MAHWEPLVGHPAPHHLKEITMTSTCIAPSSPDYYWSAPLTTQPAPEPCSDLPRAGTPAQPEVSQNRPADVDAAQAALFRELVEAGAEAYSECELFTPAQDVDAAQAAFEAALMAISTRTSTPYVAGTFAFNV